MKSITDSLSLQDLLAVLLPGALAVFFMAIGWYGLEETNGTYNFIKKEWTNAFAFGGASYFVGYVVYVMSSCLDKVYDKIKRWALGLDSGKEKLSKYPILNDVFPNLNHTHILVMTIAKFSQDKIGSGYFNENQKIIDAYQFAFRWLMKEKPEMYEEAERYLATARFFRSMVFVWLFGSIVWFFKAPERQHFYAFWLLVLSVVSFFTFLNRWRKAHHIAFKNVIILEGIKIDLPPQ